MDAKQIKDFIDAMAASDLREMEVSHEGWTLRLVRGAAVPAQPAPAAAAASTGLDVQAPLFGVVHLQQAPGQPPFVQRGQAVEAGQLLCLIEAMKIYNEVRAERGGTVADVLVISGQEVEAGQPLLRFA
jgi:acetyl-CoA carboxylase biotin carboxyl carrier protein